MEKTRKPTVAGVFCIVVGAAGVVYGIVTAPFGAFPIIAGVVAVLGGIYALRRRIGGLRLPALSSHSLAPCQSGIL